MKTFSLHTEIGNNLLTRSSLKNVFEKIKLDDSNELNIDFANIEFISRSCADEYLKLKKSTFKKLNEINQNPHIKRMFRAVSKPKSQTYIPFKKDASIIVI